MILLRSLAVIRAKAQQVRAAMKLMARAEKVLRKVFDSPEDKCREVYGIPVRW